MTLCPQGLGEKGDGNVVILVVTTGSVEDISNKIRILNISSIGFGTKKRLTNAIILHMDGLDLQQGW
ncbi:MAG: hypothetical protein OXE97_09640 [Gammaproteobacteria bacterium]|nr:hypothetical protein [Gammaproteobacteria bacterium]